MQATYSVYFVLCALQLVKCANIKVTDEVYLDIQVNGKNEGRVLIGLFGEIAPKTVKNFIHIASKGINGRTYATSRIHRVVRRFMIQGGDIVNNDGTGSISIYGDHFLDENFHLNHSAPGFVSMANFGPNSNGCQFFIITKESLWLDGSNVVFGKVIEGQEIIHKIEHMKTFANNTPKAEILISKSGKIPVKTPFYISDHPYTLSTYAKAILPPLIFSLIILGSFQWVIRKLDSCS